MPTEYIDCHGPVCWVLGNNEKFSSWNLNAYIFICIVIWGAEVMCYDRIIATYQSCWVGNCVEILLSVCHAFVPHPFYVYVQCSLCTVFYSYTKCCRKLVTKHVLAGFEFIRLQPQTHQICGFCVKQQRKTNRTDFVV